MNGAGNDSWRWRDEWKCHLFPGLSVWIPVTIQLVTQTLSQVDGPYRQNLSSRTSPRPFVSCIMIKTVNRAAPQQRVECMSGIISTTVAFMGPLHPQNNTWPQYQQEQHGRGHSGEMCPVPVHFRFVLMIQEDVHSKQLILLKMVL